MWYISFNFDKGKVAARRRRKAQGLIGTLDSLVTEKCFGNQALYLNI